jgi:lipoprotein Spr
MTRHFLFATAILISAGAFSPAQAQKKKQGSTNAAKTDVKFLDDITIDAQPIQVSTSDPKAVFSKPLFTSTARKPVEPAASSSTIENASSLQFKYALLLDTEVEQISNLSLFQTIDEWIGTRYRLGGTTKNGIDCSALMQTICSTVFGVTIPRTAREQYAASKKISRTEIREGDLIFFNTIGGVSHVGMYLQNNKFVHASSGGVTISDMYEDYWMRKFIGVGRIDEVQLTASVSNP